MLRTGINTARKTLKECNTGLFQDSRFTSASAPKPAIEFPMVNISTNELGAVAAYLSRSGGHFQHVRQTRHRLPARTQAKRGTRRNGSSVSSANRARKASTQESASIRGARKQAARQYDNTRLESREQGLHQLANFGKDRERASERTPWKGCAATRKFLHLHMREQQSKLITAQRSVRTEWKPSQTSDKYHCNRFTRKRAKLQSKKQAGVMV